MQAKQVWVTLAGLAMMMQAAACQAPMLSAPAMSVARPPQTRAASVDGFKSRLQAVIMGDMAKRDMNKDKYLSVDESTLSSLDFSRADSNKDKRLDISELVAFYQRDLYAAFSVKALQTFKALDVDGSNKLSPTEFLNVTLATPGTDGQPMRPTALLYNMTDRNRDYAVDFDEFEDMLAWDLAEMLPGSAAVTPVPQAVVPVSPPAAPKAPAVMAPGEPPHPAPERAIGY